MKIAVRNVFDKVFTGLTRASIVLLVLVLAVVLGPILYRGSSAVVFRGTVEFRRMQFAVFGHGDEQQIQSEVQQARAVRERVYEIVDEFKKGIDASALTERARKIHRDFGQELRYRQTPHEQYAELRSLSRDIRDRLEAAFEASDKAQVDESIKYVMQYRQDERLRDTIAAEYFQMAGDFQRAAARVDLAKRAEYAEQLKDVEDILFCADDRPGLLGPRPGELQPALVMNQYGATRWDQAKALLDRFLWEEKWVEQEKGKPLVKVKVERAKIFEGTELEPLFAYVRDNVREMLRPRWTFYWRYFFDDSASGHYFGGVGPEIIGTLLLTLLSMLFVIPLGVVSAAYLVECASENMVVRIIRMCINTLAGVPSIVFGLFGMAFFVLFLIPLFDGPSKPCILAGSMTLAVLTLPVMIRSSEEAIRTVPQEYKEGSLALGASRFRTFVAVTLPAALPGILTGVILSLSRVAGETAPILFTAGVALGPVPDSVLDTTRTLSYGSWDIAVGNRISALVPHKQYGMVVTLVLLVLCLNGLAIVLRSRVFRKLKGQ